MVGQGHLLTNKNKMTSKVQLIRQILSTMFKGPGFDTICSKVLIELSILHVIVENICIAFGVAAWFQVPRPLSCWLSA